MGWDGMDGGNWDPSVVWDQWGVWGRQLADNFARAMHKLQQLEYFPYSWQRQSQNSHTNCLFPCGSSRRNSTRCSAGLRSGEGKEDSGLVVVGSICISCDDSIWAKPTRQVWSQRQIETIFAHTLHIRHVAQPVCVCVASINELFACYWIRGKRAKEQRDGGG